MAEGGLSSEQAGGQEKPIISHEFVDSVSDNEVLGTHISLVGQNTALQFSSEYANNLVKRLQETRDEIFSHKPKVAPLMASLLFDTSILSKDSDIRIKHFLEEIEKKNIQTSEFQQKVDKEMGKTAERAIEPELSTKVAIAIKAAILLGYSTPAAMFDIFLHKWRWGFAIFPDLLMQDEFRKSRKKLLEIVQETTRQYAEYTERPNSAEFYNPGPPDLMIGGTYELEKVLNRTKDYSGIEALNNYVESYDETLNNSQAKDPLGLNYAALAGFRMAKARFESANSLYQQLTNTS